MGLMSRRKGKRFEQLIASKLREQWPEAIVRRASQAERADNPDVFVEGGAPVLGRLWLELNDAKEPCPREKLAQAERDSLEHANRREGVNARLPVVVWHRIGERTVWVDMRAWTFLELVYPNPPSPHLGLDTVRVSFDDFVARLKACAA